VYRAEHSGEQKKRFVSTQDYVALQDRPPLDPAIKKLYTQENKYKNKNAKKDPVQFGALEQEYFREATQYRLRSYTPVLSSLRMSRPSTSQTDRD
jgi:hypothetical protein